MELVDICQFLFCFSVLPRCALLFDKADLSFHVIFPDPLRLEVYGWVSGLVHRVRFLHGWSVLGQVNNDFHDWNMILLDPSPSHVNVFRVECRRPAFQRTFRSSSVAPCAVSQIGRFQLSQFAL